MKSSLASVRHVITYVVQHPANRGRRGRQVLRAVVFQMRKRLGATPIAKIGEHSRILVDRHCKVGSMVVYANPLDWNEMTAWRRILRSGDHFVDVGANIGTYSLWAAECGATVISVEPHPLAVARLKRNLAMNDWIIDVHPVALADQHGVMRITDGLDAENHLILDTNQDGVEVDVRTLDWVIGSRQSVFVKIDVEGAEELVVRGAGDSIRAHRILGFQLEWNDLSQRLLGRSRAALAELLEDQGFTLYRPDETGRLIPAPHPSPGSDVFALRPEVLARLAPRASDQVHEISA